MPTSRPHPQPTLAPIRLTPPTTPDHAPMPHPYSDCAPRSSHSGGPQTPVTMGPSLATCPSFPGFTPSLLGIPPTGMLPSCGWAPLAFGAPGHWPRKDRASGLGLLPPRLVPSHSQATRRLGRAEGPSSSYPCQENSRGFWTPLRIGDLPLTMEWCFAWDRRESGQSPRAPRGAVFPLGTPGGRT